MSDGALTFDSSGQQLNWAVSHQAKHKRSGDGFVILRDQDCVVAMVIDGIGSGDAAHRAASCGLDIVKRHGQLSLEAIFDKVHQELKTETRGAALGGARINLTTGMVTWAAVGDIDGLIVHEDGRRETLIQRPGTLGRSHPGARTSQHPIAPVTHITMVTDGVKSGYRNLTPAGSPKAFAQKIIRDFGRSNDDCLALSLRLAAA